jgi:hypothetical protein
MNTPIARAYIPLSELQTQCLAMQLQIRAQRKHDESLYNDGTLTELEWKARRHAHGVLSNAVHTLLQQASLSAIALDTAPANSIESITPLSLVDHAPICECLDYYLAGIV